MPSNDAGTRRCAVYTRKSSEEGLQQDFNSLDAQREACEAYIRSQASEGWRLIKTAYDDGGISGGTMERPALQQLLADIRAKKVDVVAVYKVDRLSRSLMDFLKMMEEFDRLGVSFVAITQQFNTTTSMGRLTLNILLSFAQFEREVTTERIRDKIAASKRKGMWMGGNVPLGYDVEHRKLVVNREEAKTVKLIYQRYLDLGCVRLLQEDLEKQRIRSKARVSAAGKRSGGQTFSRGALYTLLGNPVYVGETRHKKVNYEGQHEAILDRQLWQTVQQQLKDQSNARRGITGKATFSPLAGKLFDVNGGRLVPSHTVKQGRRYRYYISRQLVNGRAKDADGARRLAAPEIEAALAVAVAEILSEPATIAKLVGRATRGRNRGEAIRRIQAVRTRLEADDTQAAALRDIVGRVELRDDSLEIEIAVSALLPDLALNDETAVLRHSASLKLKRRGFETRLIIGGIDRRVPKADPAVIRLLSRAVSWWESIEAGKASIEHIAKRNKLSERYMRDILRLAFLAPDIVEAVVVGNQADNVYWDALISHSILPLAWSQQARSLAIRRL